MSGRRKSRKFSRLGRRSSASATTSLHPTHVFLSGNIVTMDPANPSAEAIALAGEQIVAVGKNEEISSLIGPRTETTDLRGRTVLPGFIDCHIHAIWYGLSLKNIELRHVRSIEEMKKLVSERTSDKNDWILGRGWDQERFVEKRFPAKQDLDEASPEKPVLLERVCGHLAVANSVALEKAGIGPNTPDPAGGIIDRDANGVPTGILRETAVSLVEKIGPVPSLHDFEDATLDACQRALEAGLTTVHCIATGIESSSSDLELRALLNLKAEGRLPLRFYVFIPIGQMKTAKELGLRNGFGDQWVRFGGVKIFTDGSLGGRTAALEAPYSDDPLNRGMTIYTQEQLDEIVSEAHRSDLQIAAHAIGDRAIGMVLEAASKARSWVAKKDLRHRIEHASVLNPDLIRRCSELGIIACVQPRFLLSDFWVVQRLGVARRKFTYPFASLLRAGVKVVGGSDCPVEPLDPLDGIAAAVDRPDSEQAVSVEDAIAFYTRNAAYASFEENVKGIIAPGRYADLVVLEKDPRKVPTSEISEIRILITVVAGRIAYRAPALN